MKLSRRGLFGLLAAPLVLDPERLLWVPGQKLISIPPTTPRIVTIDWFTRETLRILAENLRLDALTQFGYFTYPRIGETITVRRPIRAIIHTPSSGAGVDGLPPPRSAARAPAPKPVNTRRASIPVPAAQPASAAPAPACGVTRRTR